MSSFVFTFGGAGPLASQDATQTLTAIQQARASMLVGHAEGVYLTRLGHNYGVPRAPQLPSDDVRYSSLIQLLAWQPKQILFTVHKLLEILFGTQAALVASSQRSWQIYEVNANEIVIEVPEALISASNANASYVHGFSSTATAAPSTTLVADGDATVAATSLVGLNIFVWYSGVWNLHTIVSATYNSITNKTTIVVTAPVPALTGNAVFVDVPGDEVVAFRGDFIAKDSREEASSTTQGSYVEGYLASLHAAGAATLTLRDDAGLIWPTSGTVTIDPATPVEETRTYTRIGNVLTLSAITTYDHAEYIRVESQGAAPSVPIADRAYISGLGFLDVFSFYMDYTVRASGIVLRFELVGGG